MCSTEKVPVPRDQLLHVIELAENSIYMSESEFNDPPTSQQRDLMLSLYRLVGKEVPPFFARHFGWKLEGESESEKTKGAGA